MTKQVDAIELADYLQNDTVAYLIRDIELALDRGKFHKDWHQEELLKLHKAFLCASFMFNVFNDEDNTGQKLLVEAYGRENWKVALDQNKRERRLEIYSSYLHFFDQMKSELPHGSKYADGIRWLVEHL